MFLMTNLFYLASEDLSVLLHVKISTTERERCFLNKNVNLVFRFDILRVYSRLNTH